MQDKINGLLRVSWKVRLPKGFSIESIEVVVGEEIGDGWSWRAKGYIRIGDEI